MAAYDSLISQGFGSNGLAGLVDKATDRASQGLDAHFERQRQETERQKPLSARERNFAAALAGQYTMREAAIRTQLEEQQEQMQTQRNQLHAQGQSQAPGLGGIDPAAMASRAAQGTGLGVQMQQGQEQLSQLGPQSMFQTRGDMQRMEHLAPTLVKPQVATIQGQSQQQVAQTKGAAQVETAGVRATGQENVANINQTGASARATQEIAFKNKALAQQWDELKATLESAERRANTMAGSRSGDSRLKTVKDMLIATQNNLEAATNSLNSLANDPANSAARDYYIQRIAELQTQFAGLMKLAAEDSSNVTRTSTTTPGPAVPSRPPSQGGPQAPPAGPPPTQAPLGGAQGGKARRSALADAFGKE